MEYRTLGQRTGLKVSAIGFGGAPIGLQGYLSPEDRDSSAFREQALAALREAVEQGITLFDTAPGYGDGRSERLFGEALAPYRASVVLATKYPVGPDWTPESATASLRASLRRLRTGYVDLLQLHGGTFTDGYADTILRLGVLDWAESMRALGTARCLGVTAEGPSGALERLLQTGRFDAIQILYNVLYQATCDYQREPAGIVPLAKSLGVGVLAMRPATSDLLYRLLRTEFAGVTRRQVARLALNFVLSTPEIDCALVGMRSADEVRANVELADEAGLRADLSRLHDRYDFDPSP